MLTDYCVPAPDAYGQDRRQIAHQPEFGRLSSAAVPIVQADHLGLSGGHIRANNRAAVSHLLSLNSPTRSGGFWFLLS